MQITRLHHQDQTRHLLHYHIWTATHVPACVCSITNRCNYHASNHFWWPIPTVANSNNWWCTTANILNQPALVPTQRTGGQITGGFVPQSNFGKQITGGFMDTNTLSLDNKSLEMHNNNRHHRLHLDNNNWRVASNFFWTAITGGFHKRHLASK